MIILYCVFILISPAAPNTGASIIAKAISVSRVSTSSRALRAALPPCDARIPSAMVMVWTLVATCLLLASSVATFLTTLHLRCRWDVHASSVRWLFWCFFLCVFTWCSMRAIFFLYLCSRPTMERSDVDDADRWTYSQLDRLGIHGIIYLKDSTNPWLTFVLCWGDLSLLGVALTLFPLTYELARLARLSMDRGVAKERVQIRRYGLTILAILTAFAVIQLVLTLMDGGYSLYTQRLVLCIYGLQFLAFVFMAVKLLKLKADGRDIETIHGMFVVSPVYMRLKRIMYELSKFLFCPHGSLTLVRRL
jgi:hypothetical protein